jgi:hypothetical protein
MWWAAFCAASKGVSLSDSASALVSVLFWLLIS